MAANCWAYDVLTGRPHVGLCHSVQGTSEMLANWLGVPYDEVIYRVPASTTRPGSWSFGAAKRTCCPGCAKR
jgi:hypothetical protein